jgi:Ni/Fe-hydrogenase subunit HybB-like protein
MVAGVWWLLETAAYLGWLSLSVATTLRPFFLWSGLPLAIGVAVYTAFLFAQAEGRDLWQSSLLPFHLVVQALMMGNATLLILNLFIIMPAALSQAVTTAFVISLILDLFITLVGEFSIPHASEVAARAAHEILQGRYKNYFWSGSIALGHVVPFVLLLTGKMETAALAALCAIVGLYLFEYAFVMAPQEIPNS